MQRVSFEKESSQDESSEQKVEFEIPVEQAGESEDSDAAPDVAEVELRLSVRDKKAPDRLGDWVYTCVGESAEPRSVEEALSGPDSAKWKEAMQREIESIASNNVWTLVESPKDRKPISSKWVFKRKIGPDGSVFI